MTVAELIEKLKEFDGDLPVWSSDCCYGNEPLRTEPEHVTEKSFHQDVPPEGYVLIR
jgi:hypothetical protein